MLLLDIPGRARLELEHLVLDVNGTIALDGELIGGVADALDRLRGVLHIVAISADTFGTAERLAAEAGVEVHRIAPGSEGEQKIAYIDTLGPGSVAAVGNGANDEGMLREAALGIAVLGPEGAATATLAAADLVAVDIIVALALLAEPRRLVATLRR
jgi:soluble P-type ATPase